MSVWAYVDLVIDAKNLNVSVVLCYMFGGNDSGNAVRNDCSLHSWISMLSATTLCIGTT